MDKCNTPKKKIIISSNNKFSQDTFLKTQTSDTSSDKEWQQVTASDNERHYWQ